MAQISFFLVIVARAGLITEAHEVPPIFFFIHGEMGTLRDPGGPPYLTPNMQIAG